MSVPPARAPLRGGPQDFHDLMRFRIMDILLAASPYDSFLLSEAGELSERVLGEFRNLDLHYGPGLTAVSTGEEVLAQAREGARFGLIITTLHLGDMNAAQLVKRLREQGSTHPVVLLAFDSRELREFLTRHGLSGAERAFLWQGDARILLAIVKSIEDSRNVAHDTRSVGVQVILLIEDNVRYYSSFLPAIYAELLHHSQRLLTEGANLTEKILRMRARPKILLCGSYEEAWQAFGAYREDILGIVSDVEFPEGGVRAAEAGLRFARAVREVQPDVPILLQSSRPANAEAARAAGFDFLLKGSPLLLQELRRFMTENFGFGDFVFRGPDGQAFGRATDLRSLEALLHSVPAESVGYHAARNHFSKWLKARTEFALAQRLRPRKISDFPNLESLRELLITSVSEYRVARSRAVVADFDRESFDRSSEFYRIGGGSLGGKARGLVFLRRLLAERPVEQGLAGVRIAVPETVVIGTDVFDAFLEQNGLRDFAIDCDDDREIEARFLAAPMPADALADLAAFAARVSFPLAVRSSSLLEDSQHQPFTGVYETFVLANNQGSTQGRLAPLVSAVKRVYASTFSRHAKDYIRPTPYRLEEEKMAVILQRLVGVERSGRFYPDLAGVVRSRNYYPTPPLAAADGIAAVALGLGRSVVEGGPCVRFSPRHPRVPLSSLADRRWLESSQNSFWALELNGDEAGMRESEFDLGIAERDGTLAHVASTYSPADEALHDGVGRPGLRVVTFAPILKLGLFPLAEILSRLLPLGEWGMGAPVEIEFAASLPQRDGAPAEFGVLHHRPLQPQRELEELRFDEALVEGRLLCRSRQVLGHGRIEDVRDVVLVDHLRFDRASSRATAQELADFNTALLDEGRPYLLIGVGRWGSRDPWLGIPVTWDQISGARAIVEAGFRDFRVTPSQGTHFFQNLSSFHVGYFTVNPDAGDGFLDWAWLAAQPALRETACVRHLRFAEPLTILMNGSRTEGAILRP